MTLAERLGYGSMWDKSVGLLNNAISIMIGRWDNMEVTYTVMIMVTFTKHGGNRNCMMLTTNFLSKSVS